MPSPGSELASRLILQLFPYYYFILSILRANKRRLELSHNELILKGNPVRQSVEEQEGW